MTVGEQRVGSDVIRGGDRQRRAFEARRIRMEARARNEGHWLEWDWQIHEALLWVLAHWDDSGPERKEES